jgi:hypothetical protein
MQRTPFDRYRCYAAVIVLEQFQNAKPIASAFTVSHRNVLYRQIRADSLAQNVLPWQIETQREDLRRRVSFFPFSITATRRILSIMQSPGADPDRLIIVRDHAGRVAPSPGTAPHHARSA